MTKSQGRVFLTGMDQAEVERYEVPLTEAGFRVNVEEDAERSVEVLSNEAFQAVVVGYPLVPGVLGGILEIMRLKGSPNYGAGLVLIAPPDRLRAAAGLVGRGVNKALSNQEGPAVLRIVLERLIEVAQPMTLRIPVNIEVSAISGRDHFEWSTENLSGSGMLIGCDNPPEVGSAFRFVIALPGGDIEGDGIVVRHTFEGREPVNGFGARFLSFKNNGQAHLLRFLRREADQD